MSVQFAENGMLDLTNGTSLRREGLRACGTCVKAKVKCVPSETGKCQRCHRLNKVCQASTPSSRKRPQSAQVAQLERKLDSLVNLLTNPKDDAAQASSSSNDTLTSPPSVAQRRGTPSTTEDEVGLGPGQSSQPVFLACSSNTSNYTHASGTEDPFTSLDRQEAAFLLIEFRTQMSPQFPFVVIPPDTSADALNREKPMLWRAVMTAASYHKPIRQEAMGWKLMEEFSTRLLLKAEKSLDLLQALLVHLAWYHYHSAANPQATNLLFLAKSLLINLGYHLSRTLKDRPKVNLHIDGSEGLSLDEPGKTPSLSRSLEEWRALAGCFFTSAMTASSCRRMDPLLYTPHLEAVCKTLSELHEYETDRLIEPLVSIQNVVLKMSSSLQEHDASAPMSAVPIRMYMMALQSELDAIKSRMPTNMPGSASLVSVYQVAEISLYEVGLYRALWNKTDKDQRVKTLYSCLVAVKTYFDTHFSPNVRMPASLPYFIWIHNGYALLLGAKLCFVKVDGLDINHVRTLLDYGSITDRIAEKLENIVRLRTPHGKSEIFTRYITQIRCKHIAKIVRSVAPPANPESENVSSILTNGQVDGVDLPLNPFLPEDNQSFQEEMFMDDHFWQGLLDQDNDWMMFSQ